MPLYSCALEKKERNLIMSSRSSPRALIGDTENDSDYVDFSARLPGLKILAWFHKPARIFSPGCNSSRGETGFF